MLRSLRLPVLLASLASCATLEQEPYAEFGAGKTVVGASTGWAFYEAEAQAGGLSGVLQGRTGSDTTDLPPNYGGALKLHHMVTDRLALGAIVELRSFNPDPIQPLDAKLTAGDFETLHLIASSRWFFDPFGAERRWRSFVGFDVSYIPEVKLGDVEVDYAPNPIPAEHVYVKGSSYWALGAVGGVQYLLNDRTTLDLGAFYEYSITPGEATVAFQNLGGAEAKMELWPRGLIVFVGLTYSL
ncbi:MAG: hypothetical protein H6828_00090 [Planctomycetes bacterium]|nr:hypothetical protein [Planctomycetota bacterium]